MIADTGEELHKMAGLIGVQRKGHQAPPKVSNSNYDIALSKRDLAVSQGAVKITWKQAPAICFRRQKTGVLGDPSNAIEWMLANSKKRENTP